jgi:transposase
MSIVARIKVFVGLDYHSASVQVCVMDGLGKVLLNRSYANDRHEIVAAVERCCGKSVIVQAAIESCCGAANLAEELISKAGWSVDVAHPGYVNRMKQNPDKTDFSDAQLLADLERVGYLPRVWLAPEEVRELRRLVRYRQDLAKDRRGIKLRIRAMLREARIADPNCHPWTKAWLRWLRETAPLSVQSRWVMDRQLQRLEVLQESIKEVELRLRDLAVTDPQIQKLLAQPGIGLITAVTIRAEIGRFDRFRSGKQLSRFCGLSPRNASSGEKQADAGLIKAGNRELRSVLIEAAHRLARYDQRWNELNLSLRARGKKGSVVAAAIANRWIRWLFYRMQPQELAA